MDVTFEMLYGELEAFDGTDDDAAARIIAGLTAMETAVIPGMWENCFNKTGSGRAAKELERIREGFSNGRQMSAEEWSEQLVFENGVREIIAYLRSEEKALAEAA